MPIDDLMSVADPVADESRPGGSYLDYKPKEFKLDIAPEPQDQPAQPAQPPQPDMMQMSRRAREGRARDVNDFNLTVAGIADGDPVGMETFDLGFFEDGTPAIVINGANVPIRHEQWMALLNMREKTRADVQAQTMFAMAQQDAMSAVAQVEASMALPNGMAGLLYAQARNNPDAALQNLSNLYLSMQKNGGRDMMGSIAKDVQENVNRNSIDFLLRPQGEQEVTGRHPLNPDIPIKERVKIPSRRDVEVQRLSQSNAPHDQITAHAWLKLEDMLLDPNIRLGNPTQSIGIFDRIAMMEADRTGPMSLLSRLQHLAAYNNGAWPKSEVPMQYPPSFMVGTGNVPVVAQASRGQFIDYLMRLDRFAANAFGYQASDRANIAAIADEMTAVHMQQLMATMGQQPQQQAPQQAAPAPAAPRRLTPSATERSAR